MSTYLLRFIYYSKKKSSHPLSEQPCHEKILLPLTPKLPSVLQDQEDINNWGCVGVQEQHLDNHRNIISFTSQQT